VHLIAICDREEAALLVVGSRGRSALATALLDGVCANRNGARRIPVLVVPRHAPSLPDDPDLLGRVTAALQVQSDPPITLARSGEAVSTF
jgi:hypothetical protein